MVFNTHDHTRTCLDEKIEIDEKKFKIFFLTNFLKGYFKAFPEKQFFSKKHFFVFCRKFGFNFEKSSNHCSQLKKHLKVDPETRSYDILTKTHEKIPTIPNIPEVQTTLENRMILEYLIFVFVLSSYVLKLKGRKLEEHFTY